MSLWDPLREDSWFHTFQYSAFQNVSLTGFQYHVLWSLFLHVQATSAGEPNVGIRHLLSRWGSTVVTSLLRVTHRTTATLTMSMRFFSLYPQLYWICSASLQIILKGHCSICSCFGCFCWRRWAQDLSTPPSWPPSENNKLFMRENE